MLWEFLHFIMVKLVCRNPATWFILNTGLVYLLIEHYHSLIVYLYFKWWHESQIFSSTVVVDRLSHFGLWWDSFGPPSLYFYHVLYVYSILDALLNYNSFYCVLLGCQLSMLYFIDDVVVEILWDSIFKGDVEFFVVIILFVITSSY